MASKLFCYIKRINCLNSFPLVHLAIISYILDSHTLTSGGSKMQSLSQITLVWNTGETEWTSQPQKWVYKREWQNYGIFYVVRLFILHSVCLSELGHYFSGTRVKVLLLLYVCEMHFWISLKHCWFMLTIWFAFLSLPGSMAGLMEWMQEFLCSIHSFVYPYLLFTMEVWKFYLQFCKEWV